MRELAGDEIKSSENEGRDRSKSCAQDECCLRDWFEVSG